MNEVAFTKIMSLYETHLQVKKLTSSSTISLYLYSVKVFFNFCKKYQKDLMLPQNWEIENIGKRELEAFLKHQIDYEHWQKNTLVTCVSGIKSFFNYLAESQHLPSNPIQHFKLPRNFSGICKKQYDIIQIKKLFQYKIVNSLKNLQQRLLLELIYGLGMSLKKIANIASVTPELDDGTVRFYFQNSGYQDYPFNKSAIKILKLYLKLLDEYADDRSSFWINKKGKILNTPQLQNLLNSYFESHDLAKISASELRDLSVQHFSEEGADVRSLQSLRKFKQLRRLQSISNSDFSHLQNILKNKHIRNSNLQEN